MMISLQRASSLALVVAVEWSAVCCHVGATRWYSLICTTGPVQTVSYSVTSSVDDDGNGNVSFQAGGGGGGLLMGGVVVGGDGPNNSSNETGGSDRRRSLLRGDGNTDDYDYESLFSDSATPALPWAPGRSLQEEVVDGAFFFDVDVDQGNGNGSGSGSGNPETGGPSSAIRRNETQQFRVRPCMCHPTNIDKDYFGPNETIPDLYLCPEASDYCGIPFKGEGPVGCFSVTVQQVVARNAWPLILLWYFGMVVICCFTVHGSTSWEYFRVCLDRERNSEHANRLLSRNGGAGPPPPRSYWNWWGWQRYRFEQNLLAQSQWIWRHEEYHRMQQQRELGLPPPRYEMKTKRFSRDQHEEDEKNYASGGRSNIHPESEDQQQEGQHHDGDGDGDSLNEPTCTICFAPLEDGELVGDLQCRHIFHKACLKSWCTRKNACPLCNIPIANRRRTGAAAVGVVISPDTDTDTELGYDQQQEEEQFSAALPSESPSTTGPNMDGREYR